MPREVSVMVTRLDRVAMDKAKQVARRSAGAVTAAAAARFCIEQFVNGKSIRDFDPSPEDPADISQHDAAASRIS